MLCRAAALRSLMLVNTDAGTTASWSGVGPKNCTSKDLPGDAVWRLHFNDDRSRGRKSCSESIGFWG